MTQQQVLVVEDELALMETLVYNLANQGYRVEMAATGLEALEVARKHKPDLIILDIMLPGIDGIEVCRILRQEMAVLILMLTARDDVVDKVVGLEVGADDYLTKPFSMRELMARVKALLRRERLIREEVTGEIGRQQSDKVAPKELTFDDLTIDLARREVRLENKTIELKPKEFELLVFLASNRGIALSRDLILDRVWGWERINASRTVDVHIRWLRKKMEENPSEPIRIVTVRGLGYRFDG